MEQRNIAGFPLPKGAGSPRGGFSLLEMMAVVVIILTLTGVTVLTFANARPAVKVKKDASQMIAFLRNMWDLSKAGGSSLILTPDFETGKLSYTDPRSGVTVSARFSSKARVLGIKLNDRMYSSRTRDLEDDLEAEPVPEEGGDPFRDSLYISEGRGLTRIEVVFGIPKGEDPQEGYELLTLASFNLITGKGQVKWLDEEELASLLEADEENDVENNL